MVYISDLFFMDSHDLVILDIDYVNVPLVHMRNFRMKYRLSWSQYAFLSVCKRFQDYESFGWCKAGHGNGFDYITGLKNYIFWSIGISVDTGNKMFETMISKGFIYQEQTGVTDSGEPIYDTSKFKVTSKFEVTKSHKEATKGITDTPEPERQSDQPKKPKNTEGVLFQDVEFFKDIEKFKVVITEILPKLQRVDYKHYFDTFNTFYTPKGYRYSIEKWKVQVKTYLNKAVITGTLKVTEPVKTDGNKDELFAQIKKWVNRIEFPDPKDQNYRGNLLEYLDLATKAINQNLFSQEQIDYTDRIRQKVHNNTELLAYYEYRVTFVKSQNTEGVSTPPETPTESATAPELPIENTNTERAIIEKTVTTTATTEGATMEAKNTRIKKLRGKLGTPNVQRTITMQEVVEALNKELTNTKNKDSS